MVGIDPQYMISMVKGKFGETSRQDLSNVFANFKNGSKTTLVIYFHGGLVNRQAGIDNAIDLNGRYSDAAACLFPIWETGIQEVLSRNWLDIARDTVFQVARDRVMSAVFAKAKETVGIRGLTLDYQPGTFLPSDLEASANGPGDVALPMQNFDLSVLEPLTSMQEKDLEVKLAQDMKLTSVFQAAINAHVGSAPEASRSAFVDTDVAPKQSFMDKKALNALAKDSVDTRGIPLGVALRILAIVKNVILRFITRKDHGLHATTTEEILRSLYFSAVGTSFWGQIKGYTHETFKTGANYCGSALLNEIALLPANKKVLLIGHSAGAVFISELLIAAAGRGMNIPFDIIFLAPAVRANLFGDALSNAQPLIRNFRMYTMSDENERKDILIRTNSLGDGVGWFYPRSLLYFISGILEKEVDSPLVGLQRFNNPSVWDSDDGDVRAVRSFISYGQNRACWSQCSDPSNIRLDANAISHGDFGHSIMLKGVKNSTVVGIHEILKSGVF